MVLLSINRELTLSFTPLYISIYVDPFAKTRKVKFNDKNIPFDGSPFFIIVAKVFDCHHGPDRKKSFKKKLAEEKVWQLYDTNSGITIKSQIRQGRACKPKEAHVPLCRGGLMFLPGP